MNEIIEKRTPELIGAEIRMYAEAGRRITLLCGIEIGRRLVEAKELLEHGEWLPWLERETDFSTSSAQRYMQVFREYGAAQQSLFGPVANCPTLGNMSISNALRLLALPEEERESFAREVDAEHLSTRDLEQKIRERTAALEADLARAEAEKQRAALEAESLKLERDAAEKERDMIAQMRDRSEEERQTAEKALGMARDKIRDLEARPMPVAVERDEKAIEEAVAAEREKQAEKIAAAANAAVDEERKKHAEAEKEFKKKIADLSGQIGKANSERAKLETELRELAGRAEAAEKAGEDSEKLKAQVKALEGKLALAAPEVAEFKAAFDRAQAELVTMLKALRKVQDEALKAKLTGAVRTMLSNFGGQVE